MIESAVVWLLKLIAAPSVGLTSIFIISFISATLLPLGSEPAVFAVVKANPQLFWPAILVGTLGNTLGGAFDYFLGYRAKVAFAKERKTRWFGWLERYGPKTMLMSWVPASATPCARWRAGCTCRSGPACGIWLWVNLFAMSP